MTEGVYQILNFNFANAISANIFSPFIILLLIFFFIKGSVPKLDSNYKEIIFFSFFIFMSILVNVYN